MTDEVMFSEVVGRHPGCEIDAALANIEVTCRLMRDQLRHGIDSEGELFQRLKYGHKNEEDDDVQREVNITGNIYQISCLSTTFAQQVRHFAHIGSIPNDSYPVDLLKRTFDDAGLVAFVKALRNLYNHGILLRALVGYTVHLTKPRGVETRVRLPRDRLLADSRMTRAAREFVENRKEIEILSVLKEYVDKASWFATVLRNDDGSGYRHWVADYRKLRVARTNFLKWHWLSVILGNLVAKKVDPYLYLPRYFTDTELAYFRRYSDRSKKQVDTIVDYFDVFRLLEKSDIDRLYQLFGVLPTK